MIDTKELRIGNYLQRLDNSAFQVTASDVPNIEDTPSLLRPNPIPINPEWLQRLGFDVDDTVVSGVGKSEHHFSDGSLQYYFAIQAGSPYVTVKHVHQLQNLYFALTGKELTLKEVAPNGKEKTEVGC